ncbi:hypothetical protein [Nocardiopsis xinjiangensis]|uniref:hypothetical protein n=1 Tax=Nocardiopsis xinjiangensis TaxID=124285 RepID=UPI00036C03ED|nr:hypothetical protein [Nocardiopsis xinjiangensis]
MEPQLWDRMTAFVKETHEVQGADAGGVIPPTVFPFREGKLLGFARLRPVHRGEDALSGIAELSFLPAAGGADEILVAWESQDIAVACELPQLYPSSCLNLLWASSDDRLLRRMPYEEYLLPGSTEHGTARVGFDWAPRERDLHDPELEPAIASLVESSWDPMDLPPASALQTTQAYMESLGYLVELVA